MEATWTARRIVSTHCLALELATPWGVLYVSLARDGALEARYGEWLLRGTLTRTSHATGRDDGR